MQLCTTPKTSPPSSVGPQDLPFQLPTPGRAIQHLTLQVKGDLDSLKESSQKQESNYSTFPGGKGQVFSKNKTYFQHGNQDGGQPTTATKCIIENKQQVGSEMDQSYQTYDCRGIDKYEDYS